MSEAFDLNPNANGVQDLVVLDPDHPGFRDRVYRDRRNAIARIALTHVSGRPVPDASYIEEEHEVWRSVWAVLGDRHQAGICRELLELQQVVPLSRHRIPQLADFNQRLYACSAFRFEPVAGLVSARTFLRYLGQRIFLATQYIRHYSRPFYTPEPDIVHELVGHAASLVHPGIAEVHRVLGEVVDIANAAEMRRIENVYWYTMEFGLVREGADLKAFGAGLLSSVGELAEYNQHAELRDWDLDRVAATPYDPTCYQKVLYVAPSFTRMLVDVCAWVRGGKWRDEAVRDEGMTRGEPIQGESGGPS